MDNLVKKASERKSRRTHKNSRDGCPNCKAKRIKCSEELPSCFNCVKKNYRCGYLDFPAEKLDHLRKKNEKKRLEKAQKIRYSPTQATPIQSSNGSHSPSPNISNNIGNENTKQPFINPEPQIQYNKPLSNTTQVENNPTWNNVHDQNFHEISTVAGTNNHSEVTLNGHIYQSNMDPQTYLAIIQQPIADINSRISNQKEELVNAFIWESFNKLLDSSDGDFDPLTDTSKSSVEEIFDFNNINSSFNNLINPRSEITSNFISNMEISNCWVKTGENWGDKNVKLNPLPNALMKRTKFRTLKSEKNEFINHFYQLAQSDLKEMTNYNFEVTFSPVWHKSEYKRIWSSVYKQAEILNIYYCFFIERSLNVLIRKYNSSLIGDSFSNENLDSELSDHSISPTSSIFSSKDLVLLTRISYFYYGDLIKAIRKSLTKINVEYSTKISLFSCWSTFLQLHGSVETLCLMLSGTTSLFMKIVNEVDSYDQITPSIKFCLNLVNDHTSFCLVPDYNFSVVEELYRDVSSFKLFCYNNQELTSASNSMLVLLLLKLEHFLKSLINNYYPKIKSINEYYKYLNNIQDESNNIYCISFTLLYELLVEWFDLYPSEKMSMNSRMTPLKKVFYLFFSAIGKTLINVISPIRTLVGVDLCDMFFPNIETDFSVYMFERGLITEAQYQYLSSLAAKHFRIVNFFNNRIALYAYHLANGTVMDKEYLQFYKGTSHVTEYKDTIRIFPQKVKVNEVMLEKFANLTLRYSNYPNFDIFSQPNFLQYTRDPAEIRINEDISNVDLKTGLLPTDFDANPLVDEYRKVAYNVWKSSETPIEDWRQRMHNLHLGRTEISKGVKLNLYGETS